MMKLSPRSIVPLLRFAVCAGVLLGTLRAAQAVGLEYAVYDAITGIDNGVNGAFTATTGTPRNFIGDVVNFTYPQGGPVNVTAVDLGFAYRGTATTLSALNVNIVFYDSASTTGNVLTSPLTSVLTFDVRQPIVTAYNAANNTNFTVDNFVFNQGNYFYQLELPTAVQFTGQSINGIAINYAANAGAGLFTNDTLTSVLRVGPQIDRGSKGFTDPRGGFLRNASGRTDYNFDQTDSRTLSVTTPNGTFANNAGVAMRLYSDVVVVPEASTLTLLALGVAAPVAGIVLRRRKTQH